MFRPRTSPILAALAVALLLALATDAQAGPPRRYVDVPPTYTALKFGGYGLTGFSAQQEETNGLFFGFEAGVRPSPLVELAVTADWFRRRNAVSEVFLLDTPYELPVEGVIDLEHSAIDLVPLGALLRLRFPAAAGHFVPFVSGAITYDLLRMSASEHTEDGAVIFESTEYFTGVGTTIAGGLEITLGQTTGLLFEAGYHHAKPDKHINWYGNPIRARVDASGGYGRIGLKFGFR